VPPTRCEFVHRARTHVFFSFPLCSLAYAERSMQATLPRTSCFIEESDTCIPFERTFHRADDTARPSEETLRVTYGPPPSAAPTHRYMPNQVLVNVYEVNGFKHMHKLTALKEAPIGGAMHAGVEVYGREWSYGGGAGSGSGIVCDMPRTNKQHRFRETIVLPQTPLTQSQVVHVIGSLLERWPAEEYHWLHRNCLAFANELCELLGVGRLPAWIDRFARGAGALDNGVRVVAESAVGIAEGARVLMQMLYGAGACGQCTKMPSLKTPAVLVTQENALNRGGLHKVVRGDRGHYLSRHDEVPVTPPTHTPRSVSPQRPSSTANAAPGLRTQSACAPPGLPVPGGLMRLSSVNALSIDGKRSSFRHDRQRSQPSDGQSRSESCPPDTSRWECGAAPTTGSRAPAPSPVHGARRASGNSWRVRADTNEHLLEESMIPAVRQ